MSFFFTKKRNQSLLEQQILSNKNKFFRKKNLYFLKLLILVLIGTFFYTLNSKNFSINLFSQVKTFSLSLDLHQLNEHPKKEQKKIIDKIHRLLQKQPLELPLQKTLEKLEKLDLFSVISLQYFPSRTLLVQAQIKTPYLRIKADRIRYLTENGHIYGKVAKKDKQLILIDEIFPKGTVFMFDKYKSLLIPPQFNHIILEAIELYRQTQKIQDLQIEKLIYKKHRGFALKIRGKETFEVIIGYKPFAPKLKRLSNILTALSSEEKTPQIIELDYQGKAFIKTKPDKNPT